jgi:hypothetical protein
MARKRWKRKSGYYTPDLTIPKKELFNNDLFLNPIYDEWNNYRDGLRDWFSDFKSIKKIHKHRAWNDELLEKRISMNKKQKQLLKRRKARKDMSQKQ